MYTLRHRLYPRGTLPFVLWVFRNNPFRFVPYVFCLALLIGELGLLVYIPALLPGPIRTLSFPPQDLVDYLVLFFLLRWVVMGTLAQAFAIALHWRLTISGMLGIGLFLLIYLLISLVFWPLGLLFGWIGGGVARISWLHWLNNIFSYPSSKIIVTLHPSSTTDWLNLGALGFFVLLLLGLFVFMAVIDEPGSKPSLRLLVAIPILAKRYRRLVRRRRISEAQQLGQWIAADFQDAKDNLQDEVSQGNADFVRGVLGVVIEALPFGGSMGDAIRDSIGDAVGDALDDG
jgi:hypothetical protein